MSKYIDADRLRAEIEKTYKSEIQPWLSSISAKSAIYDWVLPLIDVLRREQPEVDIEKEITEHAENMPHGEFTHDSECAEHEEWAKREFYHFYELGLNARKEDEK